MINNHEWFLAASTGDLQQIQNLADQFQKSRDTNQRTALMYAAMNNQINAVQLLSRYEIGCQSQNGYTALMYAMANGHFDIAQLLQQEVHLSSINQTTALMLGAAAGLKQISIFQSCTKKFNQNGLSAVMICAIQDNSALFDTLFPTEGLLKNSHGLTTLMVAAACGRVHLVKFIMKQHPQLLKQQDSEGKTALRHAFDQLSQTEDQQNFVDIIYELVQIEGDLTANDQKTTLMLACQNNVEDIAQSYATSQIKMQDENGLTAMMYAAQIGAVQLVQMLKPDEQRMTDSKGRSAFLHAAENGQTEVFNELVQEEFEILDNEKQHVMHYAARVNCAEIIEVILETFVCQGDIEERTTLQIAAKHNSVSCFQFLDKELKQKDKNQNTVLHYAAEGDSVEGCRKFIKLNQRNKDGYSALDISLEKDCGGAFVVLMQLQKQISLVDAVQQNKAKICKTIVDVARTKKCSLYEAEFTANDQQSCKNALSVKVDKDALIFVALKNKSWDAVRILAPVFYKEVNQKGFTPLMELLQIKTEERDEKFIKAGRTLIKCGTGQQTTRETEFSVGVTALMIGVSTYKTNFTEELLQILIASEGEINDFEGKTYLEYAEKAGVLEEVEKW